MTTNNESITVAVTGASGYLGQYVCADLLARGYKVTGLCRKPVSLPASLAAERMTWHSGSVLDSTALQRLTRDAQHLVHCAFDHAPGRYRGGEGDNAAEFWHNNLQGTLALLEACAANRVKSCVLISSRAVFDGYPANEWLSDDIAPRPTTHYGALKSAEEALADRYNSATNLQVRSLRTTGVFGIRQPLEKTKWFDCIKDWLANPEAAGNFDHVDGSPATEVHGADVAAAVHLLLQPAIDNKVHYNCSDISVSQRQLAELVHCSLREEAPSPGQLASLTAPASLSGPGLNCQRLLALGWQPQGARRLLQTVAHLVQAHRSAIEHGEQF